MSNETIAVLNTETGETGQIRRKWFENPKINNGVLVEVGPDQKPYIPEMWKSKTSDTPIGDDVLDGIPDEEEDK